jgi:hypothetical protein
MKVYYSRNEIIENLRAGSYVTPDKEISQIFGREKPGVRHYCHEFEAEVRDYPRITGLDGRRIIDVTAQQIGELERCETNRRRLGTLYHNLNT